MYLNTILVQSMYVITLTTTILTERKTFISHTIKWLSINRVEYINT